MKNVIMEHSHNEKVAFAHSISADIENEKQMSKGVAVVFKKYYGKPDIKNFLTYHLAYQKAKNRAAMYGLVTKPNYYCNPAPS